jgi:hypothetical protein
MDVDDRCARETSNGETAMKTIIISTIAAAAIALSCGTALASSDSPDKGFDIYRHSISRGPHASVMVRHFLTGYAPARHRGAYEQGISENGRQTKEFRAIQVWTASRLPHLR